MVAPNLSSGNFAMWGHDTTIGKISLADLSYVEGLDVGGYIGSGAFVKAI